jgi:hypothetical protein
MNSPAFTHTYDGQKSAIALTAIKGVGSHRSLLTHRLSSKRHVDCRN